jgi:O-antigen/teichoic acid export membrane protein
MLGMLAMIAVGDCICGKLTECAGQAFQAMERLRITALLNLLAGVLRLTAAAGLWMLAGKVTAWVWAAASLSVSAVSVLTAVVLVSVKIGAPRFQLRLLGQRLAEGFGFSVAYSTTSIYNDVDKAMLTNAGMYAANGTYSVAYRIIDLACMPIRAVHAAALPHFFRAGTARTSDSVRFAKQILKRTLPYGVLAAIGLFALAPCVTWVVGSSFSAAVGGLRWLCLIPTFRSLHLSAGDAITSGGHQRLRTASQFGAAGLNFCLNLYLIPRWSWVGAAWASLLTDGMLAAVNWGILTILVRKQAEQLFTHPEEVAA